MLDESCLFDYSLLLSSMAEVFLIVETVPTEFARLIRPLNDTLCYFIFSLNLRLFLASSMKKTRIMRIVNTLMASSAERKSSLVAYCSITSVEVYFEFCKSMNWAMAHPP